jgi:ribonuclease VapC
MIVDTSALVAIILREPGFDTYWNKILDAETLPKMSAANYLETAIVVDARKNPRNSRNLDKLFDETEIEIVALTAEQAHIARAAYRDFGKGSGHKAQLNFGDCFAYALATEMREPLLFKGNDFSETDIAAA